MSANLLTFRIRSNLLNATLMQAPRITTAIPKQRYQMGDYQAVVLGDIESPDPARYHYILALVRTGESKPGFFVTCEKNPRSRAAEGSHRLRVVSEEFDEEMGSSNDWSDVDAFAAQALTLAAKVLGLGDTQPERLM